MKKTAIFYAIVLLLSFRANATHNRAGEILYKRIAPFTNVVGSVTVQVYTYSITVIKYTDHGLNIADRCVDTVYFGDGSKGVAPRINGTMTCNCGSDACGEIIVNSGSYVVKKNIYSITHTYSGSGQYVISSRDPNRNPGVHNIPNSVNVPFYIESLLIINTITGANSSPELLYAPINQASLNICFSDNPGAFDVDGDSLSYELTPCLGAPGYFYPETAPGGTFAINPTSGILTWCNPLYLDEYNVAFKVKEWRKNTSGVYQLNGCIMRDMQILVKYGVVGLKENEMEDKWNVFPNPVSTELKVRLYETGGSEAKLSIYDISGRLLQVVENPVTTGLEMKFDVSVLNKGIYTLKLEQAGQVKYKKIIKD